MTELQTLKNKKKSGKITQKEQARLKQLQDGEPLSKKDLEEANRREAERMEKDKTEYAARHAGGLVANIPEGTTVPAQGPGKLEEFNVPAEHPRIAAMKEALAPFTQIEAHDSRPNEFVLFTRGISITAGDVRKARKAMKL